MLEALHEYFKYYITNPVIVFLIVFFTTQWTFLYLKELPEEKPYFQAGQRSIAATFNGLCILFLTKGLGISSPVILLTGGPLLIIGELYLMCKDKLFTYVYLFIKVLTNFMCIYWLLVSLEGIFTSTDVVNGDVVFLLTLFIAGLWVRYLAKSPRYPTKALNFMIHNRKAGLLYFIFLLTSVVSLFFSTVVLRPIIVTDFVITGRIRIIFFIEMFLKTSLIFSSGYLLLFMKARELNEKELVKQISHNLEKEEHFRRSTQQDAFCSFYVNATADQIQEGRDCFTPYMWHDINNYAEMLQKMAFLCVYPADIAEFVELNTLEKIEKKLENGITTGEQKFRVSPKIMAELFSLPPALKTIYETTADEWVWIESKYVYSIDAKTEDISLFVSITDINDKIKKTEALIKNATEDMLTGIYNRATLQSLIEEKIKEGLESGNPKGAMLLLDVDFFKSVNDLQGHPMGDEALKTIAQNLKKVFRADDIVGRLGGDEFCVFIEGIDNRDVIRKRLEQVNKICRKDYPVPGQDPIPVSVSIGCVFCTPDITDYDMLYQRADEALYATKQAGKNAYTIYDEIKNNG